MRLPEKKVKITKQNAGKYNLDYLETVTHFSLFDLFGLVKLESGKPLPGKGWNITAIEKTEERGSNDESPYSLFYEQK